MLHFAIISENENIIGKQVFAARFIKYALKYNFLTECLKQNDNK